MNTIHTIAGLCLFSAGIAMGEPLTIDDAWMSRKLAEGVGAFADKGGATTGKKMVELLRKAPAKVELALPGVPAAEGYEQQVRSVFLLGTVYKCGKCDHWHPRGLATAWCLGTDGVMVTNHHVFEKADGDSIGVCGLDGKAYRVTGVLAKDPAADVVIFKVDATGLKPLALGDDAPVGADIDIISHPDGRFFLNTSGEVARYARAARDRAVKPCVWLNVTAEYAKGSSGGPVLAAGGRVVGMVSNTQSITYGPRGKEGADRGPHQMVIRNCVPVAAIRNLIQAPAKGASAP